jgi:uncharacterized protein YgbK (DUF1537 family)
MTPAFPPSRRSVRDGVLYVDGVPLAESDVGRDPRTPAHESFVPALLRRQTELPVETLALPLVRGGGSQLVARLRGLAQGIVVADAETPADLALIARAVIDAGFLHAVSGSAGLAGELSALLQRSSALARRDLPSIDRRVLAIIGSPHSVARAQLERAGGRVVTLPAERGGPPRHVSMEDAGGQLIEALREDHLAILCPPPLEDATPAADAAEATAAALAHLAWRLRDPSAIHGKRLVQAVVVSGGDVAAALCERLRTDHIELIDQVFPGAPLGILRGGAWDGVPIVTKSGAHGGEDGLLQIVERLRGGSPERTTAAPRARS